MLTARCFKSICNYASLTRYVCGTFAQVNVPIESRRAIGSVPHTAAWGGAVDGGPPFQVTVAFGKRFEPWVVAATAAAK